VSALQVALIIGAAFVAMEPITAATHRYVMHGFGEWLHRSHHGPRQPGWERNDWFPVIFAAIVLLAMWAGFNLDGLGALVPAGIGITAYGAAYALVHDGYIHRRLRGFGGWTSVPLDHLAAAHRVHHLYNGAPYGMLLPVVPTELRRRASTTTRDPLHRPVATSP
jgi:beta-carotene 3-hydroxylase